MRRMITNNGIVTANSKNSFNLKHLGELLPNRNKILHKKYLHVNGNLFLWVLRELNTCLQDIGKFIQIQINYERLLIKLSNKDNQKPKCFFNSSEKHLTSVLIQEMFPEKIVKIWLDLQKTPNQKQWVLHLAN